MIAQAYRLGEVLGVATWTADEAGPFQTTPVLGESWQPAGKARCLPHDYVRNGTAKLLTLFHPSDGQVRVKGVTRATNAVLHPWLQQELCAILAQLPPPPEQGPATTRQLWAFWHGGLASAPALPDDLPPLRLLLILDNLAGHRTPSFVNWLLGQGILPLYTPLGGSWLNMAESIQRILKRRALAGQYPTTPEEIISLFEAVARAWNRNPTPFEWGGKRATRRARSRQRRHSLGGSGACTHQPVQRIRRTKIEKWRLSCQMTH